MRPEDYLRTRTVRSLRQAAGDTPRPENLEEAAEQFEKVLIRQFVEVMTDDLFKTSLSGKDGPQWMDSQRTTQRDVLTDVLTEHLAASDAFEFSDLLRQKWQHSQSDSE